MYSTTENKFGRDFCSESTASARIPRDTDGVSRGYLMDGGAVLCYFFLEGRLTRCQTLHRVVLGVPNNQVLNHHASRIITTPRVLREVLAMDFIVGLPSSNRFISILVVMDRLTKYANFVALSILHSALRIAKLFCSIVPSQSWRKLFEHLDTRAPPTNQWLVWGLKPLPRGIPSIIHYG